MSEITRFRANLRAASWPETSGDADELFAGLLDLPCDERIIRCLVNPGHALADVHITQRPLLLAAEDNFTVGRPHCDREFNPESPSIMVK
jgi:hypothetical protein